MSANNLFEEDGVLRRTLLDILGNTLSVYVLPPHGGRLDRRDILSR